MALREGIFMASYSAVIQSVCKSPSESKEQSCGQSERVRCGKVHRKSGYSAYLRTIIAMA